jgi:hypothetical protein
LELGETRETAVALSGEWGGFTAWAGAFAGEREDAQDSKTPPPPWAGPRWKA